MRHMRQFIQVFLSFFAAWCLMILPLPYDWQWMRPAWLGLVLIYWIFALPGSVGIVTAWWVGLVMDLLNGELLGQYALAMIAIALLARLVRYKQRFFSFWQQVLVVVALVAVGDLILLLTQWLFGHPPKTFLYWAPTITNMLVWPWMHRLLQVYERKIFV